MLQDSYLDYEDPLVFYYGFLEPEKNMERLKLLLTRMAQLIDEKMARDPLLRYSGCIINTCGYVVWDFLSLFFCSIHSCFISSFSFIFSHLFNILSFIHL